MILYQALSSYQILECMIHRQVYCPEEKSVLILGNYITERMPGYRELETKGFFDEVYLFRFGGYKGSDQDVIRQVKEEFARRIPYEIEAFQEILAAGIHTYLEMWFCADGIPFAMFEDGSGALSRPWILADIHKKSAPGKYERISRFGLYDHTNPMITKKYCDMKSQIEGFQDEKAEDFQVLEAFWNLSEEMQEKVREVFRLPKKQARPDTVLLLTQQFANLGQLSLEGQIGIYRHLYDYYLDGRNVLIKPHPDDILYYDALFPESEIIREVFPSELLPFVFETLPEEICTVSSTGVNLIRHEFQRELFFNALYEATFPADCVYLMALKLAVYLGFERICVQGANIKQLQNLIACREELRGRIEVAGRPEKEPSVKEKDTKESERVLYLYDDREEGETKESRLLEERLALSGDALFLNTGKEYDFYNYGQKSWFWKLTPVCINERPEVGEEEEKRFTIYFYSDNERKKKMAEIFYDAEEMRHTGTAVSIEELNEDQRKIRMLEGILEATERRLLEYIGEEERLREELARLKMAEER